LKRVWSNERLLEQLLAAEDLAGLAGEPGQDPELGGRTFDG
jgi:hypothetical protein